MTSREFGALPSGETVQEFTLVNPQGTMAKIITYGATLTELHVPNARGELADVVLGFKALDGYLGRSRCWAPPWAAWPGESPAENFLSKAGITPWCKTISPPTSTEASIGFDKRVWKGHALQNEEGSEAVKLTLRSPDGEEGYPGNVDVAVTYSITGNNELVIQYEATTDRATPLSLTNHSYFNLSGEGSGSIENHHLQVHSDAVSETDAALTQLGRRKPVAGRPSDLNQSRRLGDVIPGLMNQHGDNYLVRRARQGVLVPAARVWDPASGRVMEVLTTNEYMQFFTAVILDGALKGKSGRPYLKFGGLCLECQGYSDGVNTPELGDIILKPGDLYRQTTIYRFTNS